MKRIYSAPMMEIEKIRINTNLCIESLDSSNPTNISGGPANGGNATDDDEAAIKNRGGFSGSMGSLW